MSVLVAIWNHLDAISIVILQIANLIKSFSNGSVAATNVAITKAVMVQHGVLETKVAAIEKATVT